MGYGYKLVKHFIKLLSLFLIMGGVYYIIEILWRGYSSWEMVIVGGLSALAIGIIDETKLKGLKIWQQTLLGTIIVLIIEFVSGYYLNIVLGRNIWDYSNLPFNLLGQISLLYAFLWYLLIPFGIWLDNVLRYKLFKEEMPGKLLNIYMNLLKFE